MSYSLEPLGKARYTVEGGRMRIGARRNIFALLFLPIWLTGWTIGGGAAITELLRDPNAFLVIWLCGWALGWVFAASAIGWMLWGAEIIGVEGSNLELGFAVLGWSRIKLYRGSEIRRFRSADVTAPFGGFRWDMPWTPGIGQGAGSIRFTYGARTIHAGRSQSRGDRCLTRPTLATFGDRITSLSRPRPARYPHQPRLASPPAAHSRGRGDRRG